MPPEDPDSEFASPRKSFQGRESLSTFEIVSSAATEDEMEELARLWQWEKQRADRTQEHVEFLQAEFELHRSQQRPLKRRSTILSPRRERPGPIEIIDPSDLVILGRDAKRSKSLPSTEAVQPEPGGEIEVPAEPHVIEAPTGDIQEERKEEPKEELKEEPKEPERKEPRRATIFFPKEGIFRTISQQELEAMEKDEGDNDGETTLEPPTPVDSYSHPNPPRYSRTPSVEPPSFALMAQERTSLLSLLNAPRQSEANFEFNVPSTTGDVSCAIDEDDTSIADTNESPDSHIPTETPPDHHAPAFYTMTTTTSIPVQDENAKPLVLAHGRAPSFDVNNPALTPTMTREQALAQIRERRGRARSAMLGAMTPRKQMLVNVGDRNVSAPAGRAAKGRS